MLDKDLRERNRAVAGTPEAAAEILAVQLRTGQVRSQVLALASLLGDPAAGAVMPNFAETELEDAGPEDWNEVLRLVFGAEITIPERAREFFGNILDQDREARATLDHYELVQEGDEPPPDRATALRALFDNLRTNPNHLEAINQMRKPTLQLVPVYEPEGAGFQRMVNALDNHQREGQHDMYVDDGLINRWEMNDEANGKIVRWQVAVTEGEKELPEESNSYAGQVLERQEANGELTGQLPSWQRDCKRLGVKLCEKESYCLLQMQELRLAEEGVALIEAGIDCRYWTIIGDRTRKIGSLVPDGRWDGDRMVFFGNHPEDPDHNARFRPSVVVDVP